MAYKNDNPFAPWNNPMHKDDPLAPHNDPMRKDDPFEPWNSPFGDENNLSERDRRAYGLRPRRLRPRRNEEDEY